MVGPGQSREGCLKLEPTRTLVKTLYSYDTAEERSKIQVPLQLQHEHTGFVLTDAEADQPCSSFHGLQGLLNQLNQIHRTKYTLDSEENEGGLRDALQLCIDQGWDLGTAYGHLGPGWLDWAQELKTMMDDRRKSDIEARAVAIDNSSGRITQPRLPPRRVWDLRSNRVVPWWTTAISPIQYPDPWGVSHSWMSPGLRYNVWTTINGKEWPVPIPKDTTLARIRVELLNMGAQYVWLDVLCLRQEGEPEKEEIRLKEWKLDVPTIGSIYQQNQLIFYYFSGLGLPFVIGDLDSDRHWLNRAWTLQEISEQLPMRGGIHPGSRYITNPQFDEAGEYLDREVSRFDGAFAKQLALVQAGNNVFDALRAMRKRAATSELDKVAGIGYVLRCRTLPQYDTTKTPNQAFSTILEAIDERYRGDLFFRFPRPGTDLDSGRIWAPSWDQILAAPDGELPEDTWGRLAEKVAIDAKGRTYYQGFWVDGVRVTGFSTKDPQNGRREGIFDFRDKKGEIHTFQVCPVGYHQFEIPDGIYSVVMDQYCTSFVVGQRRGGDFEKVSIFRQMWNGGVDRIGNAEFRQRLGIRQRSLILL